MKIHSETLTKVSFAKNKVTNAFMQFLCDGLAELNRIEFIDLKHLKEVKSIDWVQMLKSIATLVPTGSGRTITVSLSGYQTHLKQKEIHQYLEEDVPAIEINLV